MRPSVGIVLLLALLGLLVVAGCNVTILGPNCYGTYGSLTVTGPPNDTGRWTSTLSGQLCGNCGVSGGPFQLGSTGSQVIGGVEAAQGASVYSAYGADGCMGTLSNGSIGCPGDIGTLPCTLPAVGGARGDISVTGQDDYVINPKGAPVYNYGTWSVSMDGQTVTASYNRYTTAVSLALNLAAAIASNPRWRASSRRQPWVRTQSLARCT